MPAREGPVDRATRNAHHTLADLSRELREARLANGASQKDIGRAVGLSASRVSRLERDGLAGATYVQLARHAASVGLDLSLRTFPGARPVSDRAHLDQLDRPRAQLGNGLVWRVEVPMPIAGDQRAWDATVTRGRGWCAIDAETRLRDLQAVERRVGLKQRDAGVEVVILLVRNSRWNRQVLRMWSDAIHSTFPGSGALALEALRDGNLPASSCVMLL